MLLQIDPNRHKIAVKILLWVVMAVRPLTLSELSAALGPAVKPSANFTRDDVMRDHLSYCGYFLTIRENEIHLIHQSAKEYLLRETQDADPVLESFRIQEIFGNLEVACRCIDYLQDGALADNVSEDVTIYYLSFEEFPLLEYAVLYWTVHAQCLARSNYIFDLSHPFYGKGSRIRQHWLETFNLLDGPLFELTDSSNLLRLASCFGIVPLAENLFLRKSLKQKAKRLIDIFHRKDSEGRTALYWAAIRGHLAMVQLLLDKGADVDSEDKYNQTALIAAVSRTHTDVVRLLLKRGANTERFRQYCLSPLQHAILTGNEELVRLLLENGANIRVPIDSYSDRNITIFRLLLEKGTKIESRHRDGQLALQTAASSGVEAVALILLEKGLDIEAKDFFGFTLLHTAAEHNFLALLRLLVEEKADIEARTDWGDTVLHIAAWSCQEAMVRVLLEKGADIGAKNNSEETALHLAIRAGDKDCKAVVKLLLEEGVDFNAKNNAGETALHLAVTSDWWVRKEAAIRILLEKGADIGAKNNSGETALQLAIRAGNVELHALFGDDEF